MNYETITMLGMLLIFIGAMCWLCMIKTKPDVKLGPIEVDPIAPMSPKYSQAKHMTGKKVLITCDNWFYGHDGNSYRAAYGTLHGVFKDSEITGIKTNRHSSNWYVQVGRQIIAGCQIHYASNVEDIEVDLFNNYKTELVEGKRVKWNDTSHIYNADFKE